MAIGMAGTVAFISVTGLLKVFAGAGTAGLTFFIILEVGKIIATSAIHTYGKIIGWFYNITLSLFIVIAMAITSIGIYGFLSSSYKETFSKMENMDAQIELLEKKRDGYQGQLDLVITEKNSVTETITELSKGLSNNVIQYKDKETGQLITTTSSKTRKVLEEQLDNALDRQETLNTKSDELSEKVFDIDNEIMETKLGDDVSSELGPLKYLADVTGMTMDDVMKWFILLLIVIGDPMAVIMVIIFNKVVNHGKRDDSIGGLPMGSLIGDKPKGPEPSPSSELPNGGDLLTNPATPGAWEGPKEEVDDSQYINEDVESEDNDADVEVEDEAKEDNVFIPPVPEPKEPEPIIEFKPKEVVVNETEKKGISREDIKEIKERENKFSVTIPSRKKTNNAISRIGSNKEVRDGKNDTVFFKRR